jgi:hypothetical protein
LNLIAEIKSDIKKNKRRFLPGGAAPSAAEIDANLVLPVSIDNIDEEERQLVLSTLPGNAERLFLSELDKGLSGAKVYRLVYSIKKHRSKPFVLKIGEAKKIAQEATRTESFATPYIDIADPIVRIGPKRGALIQNFAGVGDRDSLQSLRLFARADAKCDEVVRHLFTRRLSNWYFDKKDRRRSNFTLGTLFKRYLDKGAAHGALYPEQWTNLRGWVRDATGMKWQNSKAVVTQLATRKVNSPRTIVHGDFHAQNILIDDRRECWPIDFAWTDEASSPIVDLVMLECSLKFLGIPRRADLRELFHVEQALATDYCPKASLGKVPYCREITNVLRGVRALRLVARDSFAFTFPDYRASLLMMTHALATHPDLNRPFVLASLQILAGAITADS